MITLSQIGQAEVELPDPEIGNEESLRLRTEYKRAFSGKMYSFVHKAHEKEMSFEVTGFLYPTAEELKLFFRNNLGRTFRYTDMYGDTYDVRFSEKDFSVVCQRDDSYSARFVLYLT